MAEMLITIPLSNLRRSAVNVRTTDIKRDLEELAASIAAHGLLQNLTVRKVGTNGKNPRATTKWWRAEGGLPRSSFWRSESVSPPTIRYPAMWSHTTMP